MPNSSEMESIEARVKRLEAELERCRRERATAAEEINTLQRRFRVVFDEGPVGIAFTSPSGEIQDLNARLCEILGYKRSELIGVSMTAITHDDERTDEIKRIQPLKHGETDVVRWEKRYVGKKGETVHADVEVRRLPEKPGVAAGYVGFVIDITDLKRAEKALDNNRFLLDDFYEYAPDMYASVDAETAQILNCNQTFAEVMGESKGALIGRTIFEIYHPACRELSRSIFREFLATGRVENAELTLQCASGATIPVSLNATAHRDETGRIRYSRSSLRDISDRKRAETIEQHLVALVESTHDAVVGKDLDGTIRTWNQGAREIYGYTAEEAVGKNISILVPEDREGESGRFLQRISRGERIDAFETVRIRKGGERIFVAVTISPIRDETGIIVGASTISTDLTQIKRLQHQLYEAQKRQAVGTLAGGIAHDFNNILFPIIGFTEMAVEDVPADTLLHRNLIAVLEAAKRAKELVQHILSFSREHVSEAKPLIVQPILKEALKLLRATIPANIAIESRIDKTCGEILCDPVQIHQVVMNLCTNAYHAVRPTGGAIEVQLTETTLEAENPAKLPTGAYLRLTVTDSGPGIDSESLARIFEPYFTTKREGEGTGLGLTVVRSIVAGAGGGIVAESHPGEGARFQVFFPRLESKTPKEPQRAMDRLPSGTENILIVDDETPIVRMQSQVLQRLGYRVTTKTDSVEALDYFRTGPHRIDLVITDYAMPHLTGLEMLVEMRRIRPDLPFLICTGFSEQIETKVADALGIAKILMKPIVRSELAVAIREALDKTMP